MIKKLCNVFLFVILRTGSISAQKKWFYLAAEFEKQISDDGSQVLDVRTPEEYAGSHIKNSLQADWLNKRTIYRTGCSTSTNSNPYTFIVEVVVRSNEAAKWMRNNGFQNVFELQNGFIAWKKNNKPIESDTRDTQMSMAEYHSSKSFASCFD